MKLTFSIFNIWIEKIIYIKNLTIIFQYEKINFERPE